MPPIEIRPFRRSDRDQLTRLVNAHIEAVLPGVTVSPTPCSASSNASRGSTSSTGG